MAPPDIVPPKVEYGVTYRGGRAQILYVSKIEWVSDDETYVSAGSYEGGLSGSLEYYYARRIEGQWFMRPIAGAIS